MALPAGAAVIVEVGASGTVTATPRDRTKIFVADLWRETGDREGGAGS